MLKSEPKQGLASKKHEFLLSLDGIPQTSNTNIEIKVNKMRDKISVDTDTDLNPPEENITETDLKIQKLEADKKQLQDKSQIIETLYKQKSLVLQKENQILRENKNIILLQKQEMQKYYEQQINALIQEHNYLQDQIVKNHVLA